MSLTRLQQHNRMKFFDRTANVPAMRKKIASLQLSVAREQGRANAAERWVVKIGMERGRGYEEPLMMLTVALHPREFEHQVGYVFEMEDISRKAEWIAHETANKVRQSILDYVQKSRGI